MITNAIINIDCLRGLKELPDCSVNCCVTSPPYYGLRDYGIDGQIGLEETPEQYVEKMIAVFSEVRRVLKDDGTLWLNLGDSYWGGKGQSSQAWSTEHTDRGVIQGKQHQISGKGETRPTDRKHEFIKPKDLIGIPWMVAFALRQPYERHLIKSINDRAYIAGLVDGEGCITILKTKSSHSDSQSYPPIVQIRMADTGAIDYFSSLIGANRSGPELYNSQKNANQRPSYNVKAVSQKAMELIADIYPFLRVKQKQAIVAYNHQLWRGKTNFQERSKDQIEREVFCKRLINDLNQRRDVQLPSWMVEPTVITEPGFYLRQDLIWHKPNPMPESVTDRCTKSHEYIFLLSKSARYYYDAEAIRQPVADATIQRMSQHVEYQVGSDRVPGKTNGNMKAVLKGRGSGNKERKPGTARGCPEGTGSNVCGSVPWKWEETRNKRSVWTVTTKPFSEAHFATFPEDLIVPCIKAGCPEGGTVLDPFMGAGTTAVVALRLNRQYIGFELNSEYCKIADKRITPYKAQQKLF